MPTVLSYPATTAYKQWVWEQLRKKKWVLQDLVDAIKRVDRTRTTLTTSTLSQFLGPEDVAPQPSNSTLLPAINKVFGIAPPPVCEPTDEIAQVRDRFMARWNQLNRRERDALLALLSDDA